MDWIASLRKVLRYIEEHLEEKMDAEILSKAAYVSPFYLQKGFHIVTGYSLGEYIRNSRLYEAGVRLLAGEKVIDVALRYGWESPENFTKSFTRFHGCTPGAVKKDPTRLRTFLPMKIQINITGGSKMNFSVQHLWGMKFIGFEREFSEETAYSEIPKFWSEICAKYCNDSIYAGKPPRNEQEQAIIDNCIGEFGVCIDDLGQGKFRYLIAGKYAGGILPEGMKLVEFPEGDWAKFKCIGPMPKAFHELNTQIFREWLPNNEIYEMAGAYNLEWYSCEGNQTDDNYESGIWLPVKKK